MAKKMKMKTKTKDVNGFMAHPPKNSDLGPLWYYDGMEGGVARATDYAEQLKEEGYKIEVTSKGNN